MRQMVFWQNIPSIHQAPLLREVAKLAHVPVFVLTNADLSDARKRQGWERPDFEPAQLIVSPGSAVQRRLLSTEPERTVHVFSGIHAYPFVNNAFRRAIATPAIIGVFSEPQRGNEWKGPLRLVRNRVNAMMYGRRIDFILPAGELGVTWYRRSGFPPEKLFPFGYFVEPWSGETSDQTSMDQPFRFLFVGELVRQKGVDLLLRALAGVTEFPWLLEIVGDGSDGERFRRLAIGLGLDGKVRWLGNVPNREVRRLMAVSDCLVLPSRFDGWGAVVSEALSAGTPVVCSDACGSSELLRIPAAGTVFRASSVQSLRRALFAQLSRGKVTSDLRASLSGWAESFSPRVAARYLMQIVEYVLAGGTGDRPGAPWRADYTT